MYKKSFFRGLGTGLIVGALTVTVAFNFDNAGKMIQDRAVRQMLYSRKRLELQRKRQINPMIQKIKVQQRKTPQRKIPQRKAPQRNHHQPMMAQITENPMLMVRVMCT